MHRSFAGWQSSKISDACMHKLHEGCSFDCWCGNLYSPELLMNSLLMHPLENCQSIRVNVITQDWMENSNSLQKKNSFCAWDPCTHDFFCNASFKSCQSYTVSFAVYKIVFHLKALFRFNITLVAIFNCFFMNIW